MCDDISSNRFFGICSKHGCSIYLCYHLVSDHNCHTKLSGEKQQIKMHLFSTIWTKGGEGGDTCTSAVLSAVHNHSIMPLKTQWKQTPTGQKAIYTKLLSFARERKLITSPLENKAKFTVYLICKSKKHTQKSGQMHLSSWQLTSSWVICPIKGCGTVHYQQRVSGEDKYKVLINIPRHE